MKKKRKKIAAFVLVMVCLMAVSIDTLSPASVARAEETLYNYAVAEGVKAAASNEEKDTTYTADKAVDGDSTTSTSRWATDKSEAIEARSLTVDLGVARSITQFTIVWERTNITSFQIEVGESESAYHVVYTKEGSGNIPSATTEITLDTAVSGRYVKLTVDGYDGGINNWPSVSLYEFEIMGTDKVEPTTLGGVVSMLRAPVIEKGDTKWSLPEVPAGFTIELIGADYEQIIDDDLTISQPLVDKKVAVNYRVSDGKETVETRAYEVTVPGQYTPSVSDNAKPAVVPELAEWKGGQGEFSITDDSRIVIDPAYKKELKHTAEKFQADYKEVTGKEIQIVEADDAGAEDFFFTLGSSDKGLKEEGYRIQIEDGVKVEAVQKQGAYWATRTILQILTQTGNTIPQGQIRDYPKYKVRGFMLDVGRKPFQIEFLQELVKAMAWYKMNDLQLHLNDNYIWVEEYQNEGNPFGAYSAFRLESNVKKDGNNGLNQADLTSTDVFYTKDEFRSLIKDARELGVDIIPEIDTPAHALAFTKVRPDLTMPQNSGANRWVDHLDLSKEETKEFVQSVWNEYLDGNDPVFDRETTVNIGTDEYEGSAEDYLKYTKAMIEFIQQKGRQVRLWGGFTRYKGTTEINSENVQLNIWSRDYTNPAEMYQKGFQMIAMPDQNMYIVPGTPGVGAYKDALDVEGLYNSWMPNVIYTTTIPAGSDQMLGAAFAMWNDNIDRKASGLAEIDMYRRFQNTAPVVASKTWGDGKDLTYSQLQEKLETIGLAPNINPYERAESKSERVLTYRFDNETLFDHSGNRYHGTEGENITYTDGQRGKALRLNGGTSYVTTPVRNVGPSSEISFWVKMDADAQGEQILFESQKGVFKAAQAETGEVGFSREGYAYSFHYTLPKDQWVYLTIKTSKEETALYVDNVLVDTLGKGKTGNQYATFVFPLERIGSKTSAFKGLVDELTVRQADIDGSVSAGQNALQNALFDADTYMEEESQYTTASWNAYMRARGVVEELTQKADVGEEEIGQAVAALEAAIENLEILPELPFTDVKEGDWYRRDVTDVFQKKLMNGKRPDYFGAMDSIVRAQFAQILWNKEGNPEVDTQVSGFPDVDRAAAWYTEAVIWASQNGIVTGYTSGPNKGNFGVNDPITREQMATMLYRYAKEQKAASDEKVEEIDLEALFPGETVTKFAQTAMKWCVSNGIISGQGAAPKKLNPQGYANRAECAAIISRYVNIIEEIEK